MRRRARVDDADFERVFRGLERLAVQPGGSERALRRGEPGAGYARDHVQPAAHVQVDHGGDREEGCGTGEEPGDGLPLDHDFPGPGGRARKEGAEADGAGDRRDGLPSESADGPARAETETSGSHPGAETAAQTNSRLT